MSITYKELIELRRLQRETRSGDDEGGRLKENNAHAHHVAPPNTAAAWHSTKGGQPMAKHIPAGQLITISHTRRPAAAHDATRGVGALTGPTAAMADVPSQPSTHRRLQPLCSHAPTQTASRDGCVLHTDRTRGTTVSAASYPVNTNTTLATPLLPSETYPVATEVAPKLMIPTQTLVGDLPREELLRRKRARFDDYPSLTALLTAQGVPADGGWQATDVGRRFHTLLPLHAFDDLDRYEVYTRADWLAHIRPRSHSSSHTGAAESEAEERARGAVPVCRESEEGLPCTYLHMEVNGSGEWVSGRVLDWNARTHELTVMPTGQLTCPRDLPHVLPTLMDKPKSKAQHTEDEKEACTFNVTSGVSGREVTEESTGPNNAGDTLVRTQPPADRHTASHRITVAQTTNASTRRRQVTAVVVPRVYVCLSAENPWHFAQRFAAAYRRRRCAEDIIRTRLYAQAVPVDECQTLDAAVETRIRVAAMSTPRLQQASTNLDATTVMEEVRAGYDATMHMDLLRCYRVEDSQMTLLSSLCGAREEAGHAKGRLAQQAGEEAEENDDVYDSRTNFAAVVGEAENDEITTQSGRIGERVRRDEAAMETSRAPHELLRGAWDSAGTRTATIARVARIAEAFRARSFFATTPHERGEGGVLALYQAMQQLHASVVTTQIFLFDADVEVNRPLTPQVFEDMQTNAIRMAAQHVRRSWYEAVVDVVRTQLSRSLPGKHGLSSSAAAGSSIHLQYHTESSYRGSRTHRFFTTVNVAMEDVLRHVLLANLEAWTRFLEHASHFDVTVVSMHEVRVTRKGPPTAVLEGHEADMGADPRVTAFWLRRPSHPVEPLFIVTLLDDPAAAGRGAAVTAEHTTTATTSNTNDTTPVMDYSCSADTMRCIVRTLIKRCLAEYGELRTVENRLFDFLYNPRTSFLHTLSMEDAVTQSCLARIDVLFDRVAGSMADYVATLRPFYDMAALRLADYEVAFAQRFPTTDGVEAELRHFLDRQSDILQSIPAEVSMGLVCVDCRDLRRRLSMRCVQVASSILDAMASRALAMEVELDEGYGKLVSTLTQPTESAEAVVEARRFIQGLPVTAQALQRRIAEALDIHALLERYQRGLSEEEFEHRWRAVSWPMRLDDAINARLRSLDETQRYLTASMQQRQRGLEQAVCEMQERVAGYGQYDNLSRLAEIAADVRRTSERIQSLRDQAQTFNTDEMLFDLPRTDYAHVRQLASLFEPYASLWLAVETWTNAQVQWRQASFVDIDAEAVATTSRQTMRAVQQAIRNAHPQTRLTPALIRIAESTKTAMEQFAPVVPLLSDLRTAGMQPRHWAQLSKEVGFEVNPDTTLTRLDRIHTLQLGNYCDTVARIAEVAAQEYRIETTLAAMKAVWEEQDSTRLSLQPYRQTGCFILAKDRVDALQETLDDHMLTTQSLAFSPFRQRFESELTSWEAALRGVQDVLEAWATSQKSWLYLQPIFLSEDIARQLPNENRRFQQVSRSWRTWTSRAQEVDRTMAACLESPATLTQLRECQTLLDQVEHGLNQYLENKRAAFARFYFLSDDELLTILVVAHDPRAIQPHISKLFENIARLDFASGDEVDADRAAMRGMYSAMDEYVPFRPHSLLPRKSVESWLSELETTMRTSVRAALACGLREVCEQPYGDFVQHAIGQVSLAVSQILWTQRCEAALQSDASLAAVVPQVTEELLVLVHVVRQGLSARQRMNLSGLITLQVHARDVVERLVADGVDSVYAFDWMAQLRSYWDGHDCVLRQVEAHFVYGGEYLGNTGRLVITPLTDRIYLTLTGAMHMSLGGAPAGPAGTGKTETVKDLAKALAKQCVVFNCQEGMTYLSMGKFFKGLAQAGAWACFDEFNRIDVEVLSVVAQQVSALQHAARTGQVRLPFEGSEIVVDPTHAVFITMNPGYAGRTELPDNLKVLFRPVACMVPDYAMIGEIRLFSYGYTKARALAQKMVATFRLSSEQLSSQDHYDFGMRAVNTVIAAAGQMKRRVVGGVSGSSGGGGGEEEEEEVLLLRALRDSNMPKFLADDVLLFDGIVRDLFPGVCLPEREWGCGFVPALHEAAVARELQPTEVFIHKCLQLYEMSLLRHGQMTVGPTMGGKTCATRVLQAAMTAMAKQQAAQLTTTTTTPPPPKTTTNTTVSTTTPSTSSPPSSTASEANSFTEVKVYAVNPKSVTMAQLYGGFDEITGEWRDGLIGQLFRTAAQDSSLAQQWIVFDGPVDALWIESMNTVLDDNKKLCLISGEIIVMTPQMHCLFEVEDLAVASPATVSRAGMIYMEPNSCVGVTALVRSWHMYRLPAALTAHRDALMDLCSALFPPLLQCVQTQVTEYTASVWPNLVQSCFRLYEALLRPYTASTDATQSNPRQTAALATSTSTTTATNITTMSSTSSSPPILSSSTSSSSPTVPQGDAKDESRRGSPSPAAASLWTELYVPLLVCAVAWSMGATGDGPSQSRFDACLRQELHRLGIDVGLPLLGTVHDYEYVVEEQRWVAWSDRLPAFTTAVTRSNVSTLTVPTADVMRYTFVLRRLLESHCHTLCCGPTGTGKTVLLQRLLMQEMADKKTPVAGAAAAVRTSLTPIFFTFSARTSANQTQDLLMSKLEVRRRASPQVFAPPVHTRLVLVMDDMNMPMPEVYGAQPPMELLRQWLDYGGWYDCRRREFFHVVDVTLVGAMGPPGGGRHRMTPRLVRHFHQLAFADMDDGNVRQIFTTLLIRCFADKTEAIRGRVPALVQASMEVYHEVARAMRPRPTSPHYLFNLRDLAQVMHGVASATATVRNAEEQEESSTAAAANRRETVQLLRLWLHEEMRTFGDRLVCAADVNWFEGLLRTQLEKHFRMSYEHVLPPPAAPAQDDRRHSVREGGGGGGARARIRPRHVASAETSALSASSLLFASFLPPPEEGADDLSSSPPLPEDAEEEGGVYAEVTDMNRLVRALHDRLAAYNQACAGHELHLVMFRDAVRHVCRIARVLRKPHGGHLLLLGLGGSGRQSLSRLAAYLYDYDVTQVEITKGYTMNTWQEDLKTMLRAVALRGRKVLFLFTDTQIVHEAMLEDVNNLLNSGEVPNLFAGQELDDVVLSMKPICVTENIPLDKVSIYARFVQACRAHLHIAVCMSPLGEVFRSRLRMFPALVNCCTIDWFAAWPHAALWDVAYNFFSTVPLLQQPLPTPVLAGTAAGQEKENVEKRAGAKPSHSSATRSDDDDADAEEDAMVRLCTHMCVFMHESVDVLSGQFLRETKRHNYVTATSFLELLHTFRRLLESQTAQQTTTRQRLENGLAKLKETEASVTVLRRSLAESQPALREKSESVRVLMEEIATQTTAAEQTRKEAQREREGVARNQAECAAIEQEAQSQLAEALPELNRALESLKNLKSSQITEVAGYKAPTSGVVMTMQGMCILFQIRPAMRAAGPMEEKKPDYWTTAREQLLNNPNQLLQRLIQFDKEHIPERLIQAVMPLVSSEDFRPKKIATASQACAAMCQWTHAMVRFHGVHRTVEPLRERLAVAQAANRGAMAKLQAAEDRLRDVTEALQALQARKEAADVELHALEEGVKVSELKLSRAAQLIHGLADEKQNWTAQMEALRHKAQCVLGDMLIAAGQIAYVGPFTAPFRLSLLRQWSGALRHRFALPHTTTPAPSLTSTLYDAVQGREWAAHGLPLDTVSMENALILSHARLWPLMIDPQAQANRWIRHTYADALEVLTMHTRDVMKRIEYCIRAGRPVLLENVGEELDPCLSPLLARQIFVQGGTEMIRLGDSVVPWNAKFRLFITTTLPNPHYTPEVMVRVTLLNFFITPHGLEEQLLGVVVGQERKELELRRGELVHRHAAAQADLANIQRTILRKLDEVRGDILDDVELIDYLAESKKTAREMNAEVAEAEAAEREIDASREVYRGIAAHSASLYFCAAALSSIDPMYQYSLPWFVQLFLVSIHQAPHSDDLATRLVNLREHVTYAFYTNVSRSLFEKHKLMLSFFLCLTIQSAAGRVVESELRFVLQGPLLVDTKSHGPNGRSGGSRGPRRSEKEERRNLNNDNDEDDADGASSSSSSPSPSRRVAPFWMTDLIWTELSYLDQQVPVFAGLLAHLCDAAEHAHYRDMFHSATAHRQPMSPRWTRPLSPMQRMMFLRCIRPDGLMEAVQDFVTAEMGDRFIRPPPFHLLTSFSDSHATTPLIFILSQGADPYEDWKQFAESQQMSKRLYDISLGQGQGPRAERMLQDGAENGMWVLLQNCHLATSWMPTLERLVDAMTPATTHPNFRLWLTSMPTASFPVSLLQKGVKMTNEPPKGMQANVTRSLQSYSDDFLNNCRRPPWLRKLVFAMSFFHALVQERRKFGPLGWNIPYEYTSGDLSCCVTQIRMFIDKYKEVPYRVIRELSGNIHYGGRVTDDWDRRTLNTLLETFVRPEVMQDDYAFSDLPTYRSVAAQSQQGYLDYVASWPINTPPETFGLHENADITCALSETQETLAALVQLRSEAVVVEREETPRRRRRRRRHRRRGGTAAAMDPDAHTDVAYDRTCTEEGDGNEKTEEDSQDEGEARRRDSSSSSGLMDGAAAASAAHSPADEVVLTLAHAIQGRIVRPFPLADFRERFPTRYEDSMNTVVVQEAIRYNRLIEVVHRTLDSLRLAIKGEVVMTKELEEMYQSMYNNQVPAQWAQVAYPSLKPLASWVDDLVTRLRMIQTWYTKGHPRAYWISGFFFPQAFLTGILQNFARTMQISIDVISYDFRWIDVEPESLERGPSEGCYIYGMFMEGARIDRQTFQLAESRPKILFEPTPVLWLKPAIRRIKPDPQTVYECPLYKTLRRAGTLSTTGHSTNYVLTAEIGTTVDPKHWVRRGVAMICALSP